MSVFKKYVGVVRDITEDGDPVSTYTRYYRTADVDVLLADKDREIAALKRTLGSLMAVFGRADGRYTAGSASDAAGADAATTLLVLREAQVRLRDQLNKMGITLEESE